MIIIETCPKCGCDLHDVVIATYPPIPQKKCFNCGWEWTGEPEEVIRVPFGGNDYNQFEDVSYLDYSILNGDGTLTGAFEQSACVNCPNNPKNGGSGICFCTLGSMHVTY